jgi:NDP-sugar pyrophosphorylase family protein
MKAMILAAGYGTRLRPITYQMPKPMMPVCNQPLIAYAIENLVRHGIHDVVVNLHHLPDAIETYLLDTYDEVNFWFFNEDEILGTGGGVKNAQHMLDEDDDFVLINGDTLQAPDLYALIRARRKNNALAALSLRHPPPNDKFTAVWLDDGRVTGFGTGRGEALMFGGTHVISTRIFDAMPHGDVFSIVDDVYVQLLSRETIAGVIDDNATWFDIGTPQRYLAASRALCGDGVTGAVIGARSVVEGTLENSVVWDDCRIAAGVELTNCIVTHEVALTRPMRLQNTIVCRDEPSIPPSSAYRREEGLVFASF